MNASRFSKHTVQSVTVQSVTVQEEEEEEVRAYKYEGSDVIELLHVMTLCVV
jgi:hypothetical protein